MLAISRAVSASVLGTACTVSVTFVKDIAPERMRPKVIAVIFAGFSVASVLGVPLGTFVAQICGWNAAFWLISAMLAATVLVLWRSLPCEDSRRAAAEGCRARGGFLSSQFAVFSDIRIRLNAVQILLSMAGVYVYYTYLNPLLVEIVGIPEAALPVALAAYGIMAILSNLSAGVIAERWGQRAMPVVYGAITVALALLPLTTRGHFLLGLTNCLVFGFVCTAQHAGSDDVHGRCRESVPPGAQFRVVAQPDLVQHRYRRGVARRGSSAVAGGILCMARTGGCGVHACGVLVRVLAGVR